MIDRALELLLTHDMTGFAHLWAPTGEMDFPFAGPGQPAHLDRRTAIVDYLAGYTEMLDVRGIPSQTRHPTLDPDTVIVEDRRVRGGRKSRRITESLSDALHRRHHRSRRRHRLLPLLESTRRLHSTWDRHVR